uniref:Uncharacterized protein n=1 Tax=Leersia perrieri TaxID=77586 RepID=A0A0D9V5L7_9ORYZ
MEEFQEADILWPDTAAPSSQEGAAPSEMCYELAASCCCSATSSGASLFGRCCSEGFLSGSPSTAGASNRDDDDEEELMEADVLWPDTARPVDDQPCGGERGYHWWSRCDLGLAGRRAKPVVAIAVRRDGWRPDASSPIDIPVKVAARCR